jgi:hypothetical protein
VRTDELERDRAGGRDLVERATPIHWLTGRLGEGCARTNTRRIPLFHKTG